MAMLVRKGLAATTIAAAAVLSLCFPATPGFGESALESDFKLGMRPVSGDAQALSELRQRATAGDATAKNDLAIAYFDRAPGIKQDFKEAAYRQGCQMPDIQKKEAAATRYGSSMVADIIGNKYPIK
jgi:TPR repeat protein